MLEYELSFTNTTYSRVETGVYKSCCVFNKQEIFILKKYDTEDCEFYVVLDEGNSLAKATYVSET